jgi:hypothetical protein
VAAAERTCPASRFVRHPIVEDRRDRAVLSQRQVRAPDRHEIDDGQALAEQIASYLAVYNELRPHEALDFARTLDRYLRPPSVGRHGLMIGPCS